VIAHRAAFASLAAASDGLAREEARLAALSQALDRLVPAQPITTRPGGAAPGLERTLAAVAAHARVRAAVTAITLESMAVAGAPPGSSGLVPMTALARPLPLTGDRVRAASLSMRGRYVHLEGLLEWVEHLRAHAAVLSGFAVNGERFELRLWVIGR